MRTGRSRRTTAAYQLPRRSVSQVMIGPVTSTEGGRTVPKLIVAGPFSAPEHALPGHPERPSRVDAASAGVDDLMLGTDRVDIDTRLATFDELATVHDPA